MSTTTTMTSPPMGTKSMRSAGPMSTTTSTTILKPASSTLTSTHVPSCSCNLPCLTPSAPRLYPSTTSHQRTQLLIMTRFCSDAWSAPTTPNLERSMRMPIVVPWRAPPVMLLYYMRIAPSRLTRLASVSLMLEATYITPAASVTSVSQRIVCLL